MLTTLGIAGDADDAVFVESVDDLVVEVADDFYVRKFAAKAAGTPAFDRVEALRLARRAVGDPVADRPVRVGRSEPAAELGGRVGLLPDPPVDVEAVRRVGPGGLEGVKGRAGPRRVADLERRARRAELGLRGAGGVTLR